MTRAKSVWGAGLVIVLFIALAGRAAPPRTDADVSNLVKTLDAGKDIAPAAEVAAKRHELASIMRVYLHEVQNVRGANTRDAVPERLFGALIRRELSKDAVRTRKAELIRLARLNLTIGELASHHGPASARAGMGAKQWKGYTEDLKKAARAMEQAAGKGDAKKVKIAALRMQNACNNCHADFDAAARILPPGSEVGAEVLRLAKLIGDGTKEKDIAAEAKQIQRRYAELNEVMQVYKPKDKGGIGFGKDGEGIELKIIGLGKRALAKGTLDKEKDELIDMVNITLAVAEITAHYAPTKTRGGVGPKQWNGYVAGMKKAAKDLSKAARAGNAKDLKTAASKLNNTCNNCHTDFRDN